MLLMPQLVLHLVYAFGIAKIEKNNLILIMTPEKQDKTLELSKH